MTKEEWMVVSGNRTSSAVHYGPKDYVEEIARLAPLRGDVVFEGPSPRGAKATAAVAEGSTTLGEVVLRRRVR